MFITKSPQNTDKIFWTEHAKAKLKQYVLSPARVMRIIRAPERTEEAIVKDCYAAMQTVGNKRKTKLWVMWQNIVQNKNKTSGPARQKIISAWRYPGTTQPGKSLPIPEDTLTELNQLID